MRACLMVIRSLSPSDHEIPLESRGDACPALALIVMSLLLVGCIEPAEQRARGDLAAGVGSAEGVELRVADNLAALRRMGEGELELWAQAPVLELDFELSSQARRDWLLVVHNLMPDAQLQAVSGDPSVVEQPSPRSTSRQWRLDFGTASAVRLRIATADADQAQPFGVIYFSDLQEGIEEWAVFAKAMNTEPDVRFALFGGDLSNRGTQDELARCEAALQELYFPVYQTAGNHDFASDQTSWPERFGPISFHFDFAGVHFTFVDSASATIDQLSYSRLRVWLQQAASAQHVFVTHYPLFDPAGTRGGAFRSRKEAAMLAALLAEAGVDLLLFGHIHSYYAYSVADIPAFIAGGSTTKLEEFTGIGRHFLRLELGREALSVALRRVN